MRFSREVLRIDSKSGSGGRLLIGWLEINLSRWSGADVELWIFVSGSFQKPNITSMSLDVQGWGYLVKYAYLHCGSL
jgi:hypothetical protein